MAARGGEMAGFHCFGTENLANLPVHLLVLSLTLLKLFLASLGANAASMS